MQTTNRYARPREEVGDLHVDDEGNRVAPPLWNPNAAANWSLLFTPAFGAALHMKNWAALGEHDKAKESRGWLIGTLAYLLEPIGYAVLAFAGLFAAAVVLAILMEAAGL